METNGHRLRTFRQPLFESQQAIQRLIFKCQVEHSKWGRVLSEHCAAHIDTCFLLINSSEAKIAYHIKLTKVKAMKIQNLGMHDAFSVTP